MKIAPATAAEMPAARVRPVVVTVMTGSLPAGCVPGRFRGQLRR
jgi:hypothetical protein